MKRPPVTIEGTYRAKVGNAHPRLREPVFNNWRYAVPFLGLLLIRLLWVLAARPH